MVKVFLVEDEIIVREGIKNNVKWEENGFLFCGEASDGELAYPMIQRIKPDVVITDIRMPFMDGLELSRLLKKEMPWIKIIILSGYGEFEYAKEAINIGITKYLLKPISGVELIKCVKSVRENIMKEQEEKANLLKYKQEMKENEVHEKRKLFNSMVSSSQSLANILEKGKELNLELSACSYNILLFKISMSKNSKGEYSDSTLTIQQEIDALFEGKANVIKFDCFVEGMALLLKGSNIEETLRIQNYYIKQIKQILDVHVNISYFGGVGKPVNRLGEIPLSFHEASRAFAYRYLWDTNDILDYTAISTEQMSSSQNISLEVVDVVHLDKKKVEGFLKSGEKEDITYFVEEYLKSIGSESRNSLLFRQYMVMDMYFIVVGFLEELGYGVDTIDKPFKDSTQMNVQISSFDHTKKYIDKIFVQAIALREEVAEKQYNVIINKAKEYINANLANENISLNLVASSVFISSSHFSSVFSQKTGQTFVKYLTDMRMKKAKELLKCTNMRICDIGYSVGYRDPHYFSYLFKKTQNCMPKQYRNSNQQKELL